MSLLNAHRDRIASQYSDPTEYFKQYDERMMNKRSKMAELGQIAIKDLIDQHKASEQAEIENKVENYRKSLQAERDRINGTSGYTPAALAPLLAPLTRQMGIGDDEKK